MCGSGEKMRSVICRAKHEIPNAVSDILPASRCDPEMKPESREACNEGPCGGLEWVMSRWSGVSYKILEPYSA